MQVWFSRFDRRRKMVVCRAGKNYLPWKIVPRTVLMMRWTLRYASHLGYRSPDSPLFRESVGSLDLADHIRFAAELGLAGVQDAWVASRPIEDQRILGQAMERHGLEGGCVVYTARERIRAPLWATSGPDVRANLAPALTAAIEAARRIRARCLVVLSGALPNAPVTLQL